MAGRQVTVYGGHKPRSYDFEDCSRAAEFLSQRVSSPWAIFAFMGKTLKIELGKSASDSEAAPLHIEVDGSQAGPFKCYEKELGGIVVKEGLLLAHVGPRDSSVIDRGLLWMGDTRGTTMRIGLRPEHGLELRQLAQELDLAFSRGDEFLAGVVANIQTPPYATPYPGGGNLYAGSSE